MSWAMDKNHLNELLVKYWKREAEEAREQEEALKEVWQILNVLSMCAMDDGTPYPKALSWLKEWEHLGYRQPEIK